MKKPTISVIVPVYNVQKYLDECIKSILNQTFTDFELILVNDGSTDNSGSICDEYEKSEERVKVIHQENSGVSCARNKGIEISRGQYITFIDSDDFIDKFFFKEAIKVLLENKSDIYISGVQMETWESDDIVETSLYSIKKSQFYTIKELLENMEVSYPQICICGPWCKFYKSSIIKDNGLFFDSDLCYGEDTFFNLSVFKNSKNAFFSNKCFYHYRRAEKDSLYSKFHKDIYEVVKLVYGKMRDLFEYLQCTDVAKKRFEKMYFNLLVGGIHEYYRFYKKTTNKEKKMLIKKISDDPFAFKNGIRNLDGAKNKVFYVLFKLKLHMLIAMIFKIKYKKVLFNT